MPQHTFVPLGGAAIDDDTGNPDVATPGGKAMYQRGYRLALPFCIDDKNHREAQRCGEISG